MAKSMDIRSGFYGVSAEQLAEARGRDIHERAGHPTPEIDELPIEV